MYGYDHFGMGLGMILVWIVPLVLLVLLYRGYVGGRRDRQDKTALEILEARYARGEIDQKEFQRRRADLEG